MNNNNNLTPIDTEDLEDDLLPEYDEATLRTLLKNGVRGKYGLAKETLAVQGTRGIGKADMIHNFATPQIEVNPETYEVRADGELLTCEPAKDLPLAQRYFLF